MEASISGDGWMIYIWGVPGVGTRLATSQEAYPEGDIQLMGGVLNVNGMYRKTDFCNMAQFLQFRG